MLALLGGVLVKLLGSGITGPVLDYLRQRDTSGRDIAVGQIGADRDRDIALLHAQIEANRQRSASQAAYPWIVYLIAVPPALHSAGVYLDSLPFWTPWGAHVVGSWGVPAPPGEYATTQTAILLSFFVVAPAVQAVRAVATAVARR